MAPRDAPDSARAGDAAAVPGAAWAIRLAALHRDVNQAVLASAKAGSGTRNAKGDAVGRYDIAADEAARAHLESWDVPLILDSEESGRSEIGVGAARIRVILDPVDGSDNWSRGLPLSALSCAVLPVAAPLHPEHVAAAIVAPFGGGAPWLAETGGGAWRGDVRLATSGVGDIGAALIAVELNHAAPTPELMADARGVRSYGCASRALAMVAAGEIDAYIDTRGRLTAESYLAGARLVLEAGGHVAGLDGAPLPAVAGLTERVSLIAAATRPLCAYIAERLAREAERTPAAPELAVILAAGKGERLASLARGPKPLARVLGLSLAERAVCAFAQDLAVARIIAVVGSHAEAVSGHFRAIAERRGVAIEIVEAADWPLGNGASALAVKGRTGTAPFYLAMADHIFDSAIARRLADNGAGPGEVVLAVDGDSARTFDLEDATRVKTDGDRIADIGKGLPDWDAIDTGILLCTGGLFAGIERAAAKGRHSLADGLRELAADGHARAVAVTGRDWVDVDTPAAAREAERRLLEAERGKASDGPVARAFNRPLSRRLTRYLVRTPLSPNHISGAAGLLSLLAAVLFAAGGHAALAVGGVIAQVASILDGCDGEVARLRKADSAFGAWFDSVLDRYADAALVLGLSWHAFAPSGEVVVLALGAAALVGSFLNSYTADAYDRYIAGRGPGAGRFRLGRDVRVFIIFIGALLNLALPTLLLLAVVMNVEVVRRVVVLGRQRNA